MRTVSAGNGVQLYCIYSSISFFPSLPLPSCLPPRRWKNVEHPENRSLWVPALAWHSPTFFLQDPGCPALLGICHNFCSVYSSSEKSHEQVIFEDRVCSLRMTEMPFQPWLIHLVFKNQSRLFYCIIRTNERE